ncbi:hypothetical protein HA402_015583 [Bradysia odoriphaga]|nr:hypothetical protein HA402_015583 [Bradysia odoriphaga]
MDMHTIDLEPYQYSGTNITGIRLVDPSNPIMEGITKLLVDLEPKEDDVTAEADSNEDPKTADGEDESESSTDPVKVTVQHALIYDGFLLLAEAFQQFKVAELRPKTLSCSNNEAWEYGNSITNFMRNAVVQGLTGEVKFDNRGYRSSFAVDVIELTSSGIAKVGTWNGKLNISRPEPKKSEDTMAAGDGSLKNTTFVVMISLTPPYGMLTDSTTKLSGNDRFEGFGIDLIHELSLVLGFKYEFRLQEDGKYGSVNNVTKEWDGMIGEVIHKRADLAITDLTVTAEREGGVDFTMPFMNLGISILFKKPTTLPPSTFSFMSPFSPEVWVYLGGAYLGVSLCLFVLGRISPSEWDNPYPCIEEPTELENQFSVSNSLWFSIGALLQQGSEIAPKAPSTRAVASIWWFFTLIMVSSYTANLAAFLTSQPVTHLISGAESLKNCADPGYECPVEFGAKRDGSTINFFKEAEDGTFKNMYEYMKAHPQLMTSSNNEGLELVLKSDRYAFLMESSSIEYLVERNCDVTQVGGLLDEKGYGIAMRKNSTYRSALSEAVLHLQEQGILTSLKTKWWNEKKGGGICSKDGDSGEAEELTMDNMYGVFFVLSVGSAFATLYGIFEWLMVIFLRAKRQNIGPAAVVGPSSPYTSSHCMNICDAKEIPYIDVTLDPDTKPPVINLHPHPEAIAQMFVDIINASDWRGFTIVYESAPWLPRMAKLLKLYDPKSYTITLRRINIGLHKTNFRPVLRRVKLSGETNIVLDCSIETLPELLKQVQQVGLMTENHQFIITTMDMHTIDLEPYQYSGTNITAVRLVTPASPMMGHITKCLAESEGNNGEGEWFRNEEPDRNDAEDISESSKISVQAALIFDAVLLLAEALKQLNPGRLRPKQLNCNDNEAWDSGNSITNFMRNTIVQGLTGEVRFDNRGYRSNFAADLIELTSSGISQVGTWNATLTDRLNITRQLESLRNKTFIVLTALSPPYGMLKDTTTKLSGNDRFEGFGIDLIHELSLMFGFDYEFQLQEDKDYGVKNNATGKWSGMMKELIEGRADLAITDLTITSERESGVDFTMPFMNLGISILYRKPIKEPPSTFSFMAPFSIEVWLYLGGAYLGVSLCLFILGRISPSEWDNPYPCIEEPKELFNQFSFSNSLWFSTGALLQQGSEIAPKAPSTRAVATTWWFFTLIMVSSYTANLAAFLTVENKESAIKDVEDLKDCHLPEVECPVEFGAKKTGSTINFFKESDHETYKNMHTYMMTHPELLTDDNNQGLERAKTGKYAFLMESSSIEYFIERNCDLTQVGTPLDEKGYGIAMRKDSVYRSALSEGVLRLQEQGKLTSMKTKWWKEKTKGTVCVEKETGEATELNMDNMKGVFYVLLTGSAFASLYAVAEWLIIIFVHAKRDNVPFKQELMDEIKFIIKCSGNTKTVRHRKSTSMDSRHSIESEGSGSSKDSNRHYGDR